MYSPVPVVIGDGYGSVCAVKNRVRKNGLSGKGKAALAGAIVAALGLVALVINSNSAVEPVSQESISSGVIKKVNPETGKVEIKIADPGIFMQVWWNTSAGFDKLKWWANSGLFDGNRQPSGKIRTLLGDPQVSTFTPVINIPDPETLQATIGSLAPLPAPGSDLFETVICVWKGRLEIVTPGEYNLTLKSSPKGAIFTMGSGINMIVNDVDGFYGVEKFLQRTHNFEAGFHKFALIWKAPASRADAHIGMADLFTTVHSSRLIATLSQASSTQGPTPTISPASSAASTSPRI
jgi:hypothetical protein